MHPNAELVQRGFDAFATGDMATLDQLIADDVVWVSESGGFLAGKREGKEALFAQWAMIPAKTEGTFSQEVTALYADSRVVVATVAQSATRRGKTVDGARSVIVFVVRDGKVVEGRVIAEDPDEDNAFWAE